MHKAFEKSVDTKSKLGLAPKLVSAHEWQEPNEVNMEFSTKMRNTNNETLTPLDLDDFFEEVKNLILVLVVLTIVYFCFFAVNWIGDDENKYLLLSIPFMDK